MVLQFNMPKFYKILLLNNSMVEQDQKEKIIRKVWIGGNNQLYITIPKNQGIVKGDFIEVKKIK